MLRLVLALLTAAVCSTTTAAAQAPVRAAADGELVVTYTVVGPLNTRSADPLSLPTDLVDRLVGEPHLARLEIEPRGGGSTLTATFVFRDHARFRAWYASPGARDLLRQLAARLAEALYRLDVLRDSTARYLRLDTGAAPPR
ncbi:MAG TPA: hypothetical protein VGB66_01000 [Longimicrobium sp.]